MARLGKIDKGVGDGANYFEGGGGGILGESSIFIGVQKSVFLYYNS